MAKLKFLIPILIFLSGVISISFTRRSPSTSQGDVGDVKHSLLPPEEFVNQNGSGWILLAGQKVSGSRVAMIDTSLTNLPDARGMFIRGMSQSRKDGLQDPFETENSRPRRVGEFQGGMIKAHNHSYTTRASFQARSGGSTANVWRNVSGQNSGAFGGTENRPRNISVYTYIKINKD